MQERTHEKHESLWWLAIAPAIWIVHLLATYTTAAIFCAKAGRDASLDPVHVAIAVYTAGALVGVIAIGVRGLRRHRIGGAATPHDFDTQEDRHRFLGFATFLLSGLSAVGIVFVALPALFVGTCR